MNDIEMIRNLFKQFPDPKYLDAINRLEKKLNHKFVKTIHGKKKI